MPDFQSHLEHSYAPTLAWDPKEGRYVGQTRFRIRYAETDRMGVAYNAHYLTWFEIGRTEFMRATGLPYREVEARGRNLPIIQAELRLRSPVRYDDFLTTETWIERIRSRSITFAYRILHEGGVVAEGRTVHACVRTSDGRSARVPD